VCSSDLFGAITHSNSKPESKNNET